MSEADSEMTGPEIEEKAAKIEEAESGYETGKVEGEAGHGANDGEAEQPWREPTRLHSLARDQPPHLSLNWQFREGCARPDSGSCH